MKRIIAITTIAAALLLGGTAHAMEQGIPLRCTPIGQHGWQHCTDPTGKITELPPMPEDFNAPWQWLILIPPVSTGYEVLTSAPLDDWQEADSFFSAEACAQAIAANWASSYTANFALRQGDMALNQLVAVREQAQHATCIASNDPRLR
jgi:hypothetical protein